MRWLLTMLLPLTCWLAAMPQAIGGDAAGKENLPAGALLRLGDARFWMKGRIQALAFSPDSKTLAAVGPCGTEGEDAPSATLLEIPSGKEGRRLSDLPDELLDVAFSPDGRALAGIGHWDLHVWDTATGMRRHHFSLRKQQTIAFSDWPSGAVAYSPDGRIVAATEGNTISLRDAASGRELRRLQGHATTIIALAFSPDGQTLAASSVPSRNVDPKAKKIETQRGALRFWDVANGKTLREIPYGSGKPPIDLLPFQALHFCGGGKILAAWRQETGVSLRDAATGREIGTIAGSFASVAFSADGKRLATGGPEIRIWELPAGRQLCSFAGSEEMRRLTFSPDGKMLAAVSGEYRDRVRLWDVDCGKEIGSARGHRGGVHSLCCNADGRTLISAGADGTIRFWDLAQGKQWRVLEPRQVGLRSIALSANGQILAVQNAADTVTFWSAEGKRIGRFPGKREGIIFGQWHGAKPLLAFSPSGLGTFAGDRDGALRVWDADLTKKPRILPADADKPIPVALSPDGGVFASLGFELPDYEGRGGDAVLHVRRLDSGEKMWHAKGKRDDAFWTAAFSPNGKILAVSRSRGPDFHGHLHDHQLQLWEIASGKRFFTLDLPHQVSALAFSPDGKLVATANGPNWPDNDRALRIWDVSTGRLREVLPGSGGLVQALTFSPEGRRLFSGSADGTILVWDTHWPHPRPRRTRRELSDEQLRRAWEDLAGDDAAPAFRALCDLAAVPHRSLPFLREHLPLPPPLDRPRIAQLIADLDSDEFALRTKARLELEKQGELAEEALVKTLQKRPSLEMRRQIEALLAPLRTPLHGEYLRRSRVMIALEWMQTPEARRFLEKLAQGTPEARLTREAKAALRRFAAIKP